MISKAEKAALDKKMADPDYTGNVLSTHSTGASKAAADLEELKKTSKYEKAKKKGLRADIINALDESAKDQDVIEQEKIQAQKFPGDVKDAVRTIQHEAPKKNLVIGKETRERSKEANRELKVKENKK